MSRYLFPPMLNTMKSPTLSAVGKVARKVSKLARSCRCMILNHRASVLSLSGCCSQNWRNVLREIMCMKREYLEMRYCAIYDRPWKILCAILPPCPPPPAVPRPSPSVHPGDSPPPSDADIAAVVQKVSHRVIRTLRRLSYLEAGTDDVVATGHDPLRDDAPELARTMAASVQQRLTFGERAGQRVRRLGAGPCPWRV